MEGGQEPLRRPAPAALLAPRPGGDPRILILDEATASVDSQTELALSQALAAARRGRTTIAIAHRLSTIVDANEILLLSRGQVSEARYPQRADGRGGHYAQLFEMQSQGLARREAA